MKPFTQVVLVLGIITLVFYALNPVEAFNNNNSSSLTTLLERYNQMTPEQQQAIQNQAEDQEQQSDQSAVTWNKNQVDYGDSY
jgi:predicted PurR-regulated permease PerM